MRRSCATPVQNPTGASSRPGDRGSLTLAGVILSAQPVTCLNGVENDAARGTDYITLSHGSNSYKPRPNTYIDGKDR
jgi:hypothetical protein